MRAIEAAYQKFCRDRFPLPTEEQVAALERHIGITFPEHYREFVLNFNGGWFTEPQIVPPSKACPVDRLTVLDGIGADHPSAELASEAHLALFDDNDPPHVVPIGYTIMGNLLILLTHPEPDDRGVIMLKRAYHEEYHRLAGTMEEFVGLLREPV